MIVHTTAKTSDELRQVLALQKNNLPQNLSNEQKAAQGFVTVVHTLETLQKMNSIEQSIIAKNDDQVIGYLLAMTRESRYDIPVLVPMFEAFDNVVYKNKRIADYKYIVVGQVCIADGWRGRGILDDCYQEYRRHFRSKYDFAITEIHETNKRSINAHKRIGFDTVNRYQDPAGDNWEIVLWEWRE